MAPVLAAGNRVAAKPAAENANAAIRITAQVTGIPKKRHIPERSCIACGLKGPKGDFLRVVRTPIGSVRPDTKGRANGRGAYLCHRVGCWEKGIAKRALERSLRARVSQEDLEQLQSYYIEIIASGGPDASTGTAAAVSPGAGI